MENTSNLLKHDHLVLDQRTFQNSEHVIVWDKGTIVREFDANYGYVGAVNSLKRFLKENEHLGIIYS